MKKLFFIWGCLCALALCSCSNDDGPEMPGNAITVNMMNEANGKTLLGQSDLYINLANNFYTAQCGIAEINGKPSAKPAITQLAHEMAVKPGKYYQLFPANMIQPFPSGTYAFRLDEIFYNLHVDAYIQSDKEIKGGIVTYAETHPEANGLPQWGESIGRLDAPDEQLSYTFPKDSEIEWIGQPYTSEDDFDIIIHGNELTVKLLTDVNKISGPYGLYYVNVRNGHVFTQVVVKVGC